MPAYECPTPAEPDETIGPPPSNLTGGETGRAPNALACRPAKRTEISALLVGILQDHWKNSASRVRDPVLNRYVFGTKGPTALQIYAEGDESVNPGQQPELVVRMGARQPSGSPGFGGIATHTMPGFPAGGNAVRGLHLSSYHTVVCRAKLIGEADAFAEEVIDLIGLTFAGVIRQALHLDRFAYVRDDEPAKEEDGVWALPVAFGWHAQKYVELRPQVPVLRGTVLDVTPRRPPGST